MKPLILEALDIGHSEVVLVVELVEASGAVVELVEVTTLSALSGRKAMRSDTEPGSQGVSYSAIRLQSNDGTEIDFDKVPIPVGEDLDHIFIVIVMLFYRSSFWKSHAWRTWI